MKPLGRNPRGWPRRRRCWRGHNGTAVDPVVPLHGLKDRTECSKLENHSSVNSVGDQMASSEGRERWGTTSTGCKAIRNSIQRALQTSRARKQSKEKKTQRGPEARENHYNRPPSDCSLVRSRRSAKLIRLDGNPPSTGYGDTVCLRDTRGPLQLKSSQVQ